MNNTMITMMVNAMMFAKRLKNVDRESCYEIRHAKGMLIFGKMEVVSISFVEKFAKTQTLLDCSAAIDAMKELFDIHDEFIDGWDEIIELSQNNSSFLGRQLDIMNTWTEVYDYDALRLLQKGLVVYNQHKEPYLKFKCLLCYAKESNIYELDTMDCAYDRCFSICDQLSELTNSGKQMKPQLDDLNSKLDFMSNKLNTIEAFHMCEMEEEKHYYSPDEFDDVSFEEFKYQMDIVELHEEDRKIIEICKSAWRPANEFDILIDTMAQGFYENAMPALEKCFERFRIILERTLFVTKSNTTTAIEFVRSYIDEIEQRNKYMVIQLQEKKANANFFRVWDQEKYQLRI